jgi:hypothetical protein
MWAHGHPSPTLRPSTSYQLMVSRSGTGNEGLNRWRSAGFPLFPGREVRVDSRCLDCADPVVARFRDDEILEVSSPSAVGHVQHPFRQWRDLPMPFN